MLLRWWVWPHWVFDEIHSLDLAGGRGGQPVFRAVLPRQGQGRTRVDQDADVAEGARRAVDYPDCLPRRVVPGGLDRLAHGTRSTRGVVVDRSKAQRSEPWPRQTPRAA